MSRGKILVIEDEENIAKLVTLYLKKEGFHVDWASDGKIGLEKAAGNDYKTIILDLMLPDADGFDVCKEIRRKNAVPIIMLTAKDTEVDKVVGLEIGADDYVTKPFSPRELAARVKAVLRRVEKSDGAEERIEIGRLVLDGKRRQVTKKNKEIILTAKEFDLLFYLSANKGLVLSRRQILSTVWGYDYVGDTRTVDVHVNQIRSKLGSECPIATVWGVGYKVNDQI